MTDEKILLKAIEKAKKNGFKLDCRVFEDCWWINYIDYYEKIIFSHDFAKAFFSEEKPLPSHADRWTRFKHAFDPNTKHGWQYHLRQMVLEKEPLKYLERFLET